MPNHYFYVRPDDERAVWEEKDRQSRQTQAAVNSLPVEAVDRIAQVARDHPSISPGLAAAIAVANLDADTSNILAQTEAIQQAKDRPAHMDAWAAVKGTARAALLGLMELGHQSSRAISSATYALATDERPGLDPFGSDIRQYFEAFDRYGPSPLARVAHTGLVSRQRIDIGEGIFPAGRIGQQVDLARRSVTLPDHRPATPENWMVGKVAEPGTRPYQIATGALGMVRELVTDPLLFADAPIRGALIARQAFTPARALNRYGLITGTRQSILPEQFVDNWLKGSREGEVFRRWAVDTTDFETIRRHIPDVRIARQLADATDDAQVIDVMEQALGKTVRAAPVVPFGYRVASRLDDLGLNVLVRNADQIADRLRTPRPFKIGHQVPRSSIPLSDPELAVSRFVDDMVNKGLTKEQIGSYSRQMADALLDGGVFARWQAWDVYQRMMKDFGKRLKEIGHDGDVVNSLTKIIGGPEHSREFGVRAFNIDDIASTNGPVHASFPGTKMLVSGTDSIPAPSPHLAVELMDESIPLHDHIKIKRATGVISRLVNVPGTKEGSLLRRAAVRAAHPVAKSGWTAIDALWIAQSAVWTPLQLISRLAWPVRIVTEEQFRMWGRGYDSMVNHPLSYWAWALGVKGNVDILGNPIAAANEFQKAMTRHVRGVTGRLPKEVVYDWVPVAKGNITDKKFVNAWQIEVGKLAKDDMAVKVADDLVNGDTSLAAAKEFFRDGDVRIAMASANDDFLVLVDDAVAREKGFRSALHASDEYVDSIAARITQNTGNDPELIEAIATGKLRGQTLNEWSLDSKNVRKVVQSALAEKLDHSPTWLVMPRVDAAASESNVRQVLKQAEESLWYALGAVPSNTLSRSPLFKQAYWQRMVEVVQWADDETKQAILAAARQHLTEFNVEELKGIASMLDKVGVDVQTLSAKGIIRNLEKAAGKVKRAEKAADPSTLPILELNESLIANAWDVPFSLQADRPQVFNIHRWLGRSDPPVVPGVHGDLARRLEDADDARIAETLRRAIADADEDDFRQIASNENLRDAIANLDVVAKEASIAVLSRMMSSGHKVLYETFDNTIGYHYKVLDEVDLAELPASEYTSFADNLVVVPENQLDSLVSKRGTLPGDRRLVHSIEEADHLAKNYALGTANDLLYSLDKRGQFADAFRLIFPFAEAWKEIGVSWAKILAHNPLMFRRAQIIIEGGKEAGFIYPDPSTGQEMYAQPAGGIAHRLVFGGAETDPEVSTTLSSPLEAVNLFAGQMLPGIGPVMQWPAAMFLPDHPKWDETRDILLPFGDQDVETPFDITKAAMPSWVRKMAVGIWGEKVDSRLWNATIADTIRALSATGQYDLTEEGQRQLQLDATKAARRLLVIRAAGQAILPSAPRINFEFRVDADRDVVNKLHNILTVGPNGDVRSFGRADSGYLSTALFSAAYAKFLNETNGDTTAALQAFVNLFGFDMDRHRAFVASILQGKYDTKGRRATSKTGEQWERAHPEIVATIPHVVGYFAPDPDIRDAGIDAFFRKLDTGEAVALTPSQFMEFATKTLAWSIYREKQAQVEGRNDLDARAFKAQWAQWLDRHFYGWRDDSSIPSADLDKKIEEVEKAITLPTVTAMPAGKVAAEYMAKRRQVLDALLALPDVPAERQAVRALRGRNATETARQWLRDWGEYFAKTTPEFRPLWNEVLSRELEKKKEEDDDGDNSEETS